MGPLAFQLRRGRPATRAGNLASCGQTAGPSAKPSRWTTLRRRWFQLARLTPAAAVVNASSLVYRVSFSENVAGVSTGAFQLSPTGTATGTIASISTSTGTTVDVTVSGVSGDGTLRLDLNGSGTGITDVAGNGINGGFTSGQTYTIDNTVPSILIGAPSLSVTRGGPVTYPITYADANFAASTLVAGNISLNTTGTANASVSVSGSGTA